MARFKYEDAKYFTEIESNSGCKLLSKEYKDIHSKMVFECKCGREFETSFTKFKHRNKRQCNECGRKNSQKKNFLKYEDVKYFIEVESKSGCKLISKKYIGAREGMLFECKCGNEFKTTWNSFASKNKRQCKLFYDNIA